MTAAAACADLLFAAQLRGAAARAGCRLLLLGPRDDLTTRLAAERPGLFLLDLDARWLDAPGLIRRLRAEPATAVLPVIAFVSHVRTDAIAEARSAGADRVLARSAFLRELPDLLGARRS